MAFYNILPDQWAVGAGVLIFISVIVLLSANKRQRDAVLVRLNLHKRRISGASTPPRSFSPSKKASTVGTSGKDSSGPVLSTPDYRCAFPPSRRSALAEIVEDAGSEQASVLLRPEPSTDHFQNNILSTGVTPRSEDDRTKYTATGFTLEEIEALGAFPAYDILSGVPLPEPYKEFELSKALPRPYRPFRWAYHQTMSLTKLEPDWWLEVENTYISRVKQRQDLFKEHGAAVLDYLPGSEIACREIMEMSLQFYCARYPTLFSLSADKKTFVNSILNTTTDLENTHPLHVLLNNVPEDFAIMLRNAEDGMYYFRAGIICSSLGWNVGTKIGMQLREIHKPIPDYKEKMSFSMDRYFSKMPTNSPIQRGSWGLEVETPLFMPPGHPHEKLRESQKADLTIEDCYLRVDWQTLRRLPLSAAIVFNFKAVFTPIQEFRDEPYIPSLLLKIMKEGKENLMAYKNTWHVEHVCIPTLEEYEREQIEKGMVKPEPGEEQWTVSTLAESPFFPGWEGKWHRQQGF